MIREPRERGVEGQMREAARIDNFVAMDVSVPFRAQDIFPGLGWANTPIRIRVFSCKQNKRAGGWSWFRHHPVSEASRRNSFFPSAAPPPLDSTHPPTLHLSAISATLRWRVQKDRFDRFNVPMCGAFRERTMDPSSSWRLSTQNRRSAHCALEPQKCLHLP